MVKNGKLRLATLMGLALLMLALVLLTLQARVSLASPVPAALQASSLDVVVSEIAWMGTTTSSSDEWIELYNNTAVSVSLAGWTLSDGDDISITLDGDIPAGSHYLLERTNDDSVPGVPNDETYSGGMSNTGESLTLRDASSNIIDQVDCSAGWFAGHNEGRVPMVRVDTTVSGSQEDNWTYNPRCGTATNSDGISRTCTLTVTNVGQALDYTVYFNERFTATATTTAHTTIEDALLAHIGAASDTIDVALYGLNRQSVVSALIAARDRGVTLRVVSDDEAATGEYADAYQTLTDEGITVVTDTSTSKIQHNKFLVIDGQVVWTGSVNFTDTGLTLNANNGIVITDTTLAGLYTAEFEEMWAGNFQEDKGDDPPHLLDYAGTSLESYFSPTDLVAFEVWDELANADESIHFAMFFWTDDLLTDRVVERLGSGVEVHGVWDALGGGSPYSADELLCAAGARIKIEDFAGKVHHKFAVIDVNGSDPVVILGSYNWTASGAYDNDENTLIIHDAALAQAYYEEWQRLWSALGTDRMCNPYQVHLPLTLRAYDSTPQQPDIEITHIEYNPPEDDVEGEYVRIENSGGAAADMTGWTLRDEASHVYTFPTFTLGSGASVRVWTKSGTDGAVDLYWGSGSAIWNNTGDTAYLRDDQGNPIDSYGY